MNAEEDLVYRLQLLRTKNIGALTYRYLIHKWKTAFHALQSIKLTHHIYPIEEIHKEILATYEAGGKFLLHDSSDYPNILNTFNASPIITYKGNISLLKQQMVAIVGTRNPSAHGIKFCTYVAQKLIQKNITIVSGTAMGIDTAAHNAGLQNTIGVLPSGLQDLNTLNIKMCNTIGEYGLLITDQPFFIPSATYQFAQRNRLIAALCQHIIIIEAPINSGALITANCAIEMKKNIYIMPGRPFDIKTEGSNAFLQEYMKSENIHILLNADINIYDIHIQEDLICLFDNHYKEEYEKIVLNLINETPITISDLHKFASMSISTLLTILSNLELKGKIHILNHTVYLNNK